MTLYGGILVVKIKNRFLDSEIDDSIVGCMDMLCP